MTFAHGSKNCDIRDYPSSEIRELRDGSARQNRDDARMSDPQRPIKIWLRERVNALPHGYKARLAAAMQISPDMVTKIMEIDDPRPKKRRQIKPHEIEPMARFLNALPPGYEAMTHWLAQASDEPSGSDSLDAQFAALRSMFTDLPPEARPAALAELAALLAQRSSDGAKSGERS